MNTQSIIVYRNPLEQMFWEGGALPLFVFLLSSLVFILVTMKIVEVVFRHFKWSRWGNKYTFTQYAFIAASLVGALVLTAKVVG
jgi:hypothetical protein